jgi:hypothetical protein
MTEPIPALYIELLDPSPLQRLVLQRDEFKLAIKGVTLIEQELLACVEEALVEKLEGGLRGFRRRLNFAVALGIIPPKYKQLLAALGDLRNDFAHGSIESISAERKEALVKQIDAVMPEAPLKKSAFTALRAEPAAVALGTALATALAVVKVGGDVAREKRNAASPDALREALARYLAERREGRTGGPTE